MFAHGDAVYRGSRCDGDDPGRRPTAAAVPAGATAWDDWLAAHDEWGRPRPSPPA